MLAEIACQRLKTNLECGFTQRRTALKFLHLGYFAVAVVMDEIDSNIKEIDSIVFIDLESTGLSEQEVTKTRITEISMVHVLRKHILSCDIPRVLNKINLCVYPRKLVSETAIRLTGLSNELLEDQIAFDDSLATLLHCFLNRCPGRICLVAHNGNEFDFKLLRAELGRLQKDLTENIMCADSLVGFREILSHTAKRKRSTGIIMEDVLWEDIRFAREEIQFDEWMIEGGPSKKKSISQEINETTPKPIPRILGARKALFTPIEDVILSSFKLNDIYFGLFKESIPLSHQAESDTIALMKCILKIGNPMLKWFDKNCVPLNNIKRMW